MGEKPACLKCGGHHWRFVRCNETEAQDAIEQAAAHRREAAKVYPDWGNAPGVWVGSVQPPADFHVPAKTTPPEAA